IDNEKHDLSTDEEDNNKRRKAPLQVQKQAPQSGISVKMLAKKFLDRYREKMLDTIKIKYDSAKSIQMVHDFVRGFPEHNKLWGVDRHFKTTILTELYEEVETVDEIGKRKWRPLFSYIMM